MKLYINVNNEEKKSMIMPYIIYIFENTNILSANLPIVTDMQINLHFD